MYVPPTRVMWQKLKEVTLSKVKNVGMMVGKAFLLQEVVHTAAYYNDILSESTPGHIVESPTNGSSFRLFEGAGEYIMAPLWVKERGIIRANDEFSALHEAGHSRQPIRFIDTAAALPLFTKMRTIPAIGLSWALMWLARSVQERHADICALQRCTQEGLTTALGRFDTSTQLEVVHFPPDTHQSTPERAFAIYRRLQQLKTSDPNIAPKDLPLEPFILFCSVGPFSYQRRISL